MFGTTLYLADGLTIQDNEKKINFYCVYPLYMRLNAETAIYPIIRCKITY